MGLLKSLSLRKDLNKMIGDASDANNESSGGLKRHLSATSLVLLGIGGIIGAGIFSITGTAAANYAGPGIVYSFIIGGILCAFAGLCYAELAAMVPVSGSAYAYSYATLGEFVAWIIGWDLILEYAFGAVTVSTSWSGYFVSLMTKTLGIEVSDTVWRLTKGPFEMVTLPSGEVISGLWNLPASFVAILVGMILFRGIKGSAIVNNVIVFIKVAIILGFIILGWSVIQPENWVGNPDASGLLSLIPPVGPAFRNGEEITSFGIQGVLTGAGVLFFAYIGFDAVSTTAQEAKNPQRDLPIGILGSLVVCTIIYILMALVMTGVVNYKELGVPDPVAIGVDRIVSLHGWGEGTQKLISFFVKLGALAGLTSVILVLMLGQTRIFYAMAKDRLLPWFDSVHPTHQTPHVATILTAILVAIAGGCMPMSIVGELVSIGTLLAFVLVCAGVIILRIKEPNMKRPFKTPFYLPVALGGILSCVYVMMQLPHDTWSRLIIWLILGFVIYGAYGYRHSIVQNEKR